MRGLHNEPQSVTLRAAPASFLDAMAWQSIMSEGGMSLGMLARRFNLADDEATKLLYRLVGNKLASAEWAARGRAEPIRKVKPAPVPKAKQLDTITLKVDVDTSAIDEALNRAASLFESARKELAKLWFEMDKHAFSGADLMRGFEQPEPVEMVAGEAMTFAERIASIEVGEGDTLVITAPGLLTIAQHAAIKDGVRAAIPHVGGVLLLTHGLELSHVLRAPAVVTGTACDLSCHEQPTCQPVAQPSPTEMVQCVKDRMHGMEVC